MYQIYNEDIDSGENLEELMEQTRQRRKQKSMNELKNTIEHLKHSELNKNERQFVYEIQTLMERGINTIEQLPTYATSKLQYLCMLHQIDASKPFKSLFHN